MPILTVNPLKWNEMTNSYIGSSTVSLQAMGVKTDYAEVAALSGFAFKLSFYQPEFCPSSVDATCGFDCSTVLWQNFGYTNQFLGCDLKKPEDIRRVRMVLIRQLRLGRPVPAIGIRVADEWGVICGEQDNGEKLICHSYFDSTDEAVPVDKFPWIVSIADGDGGKLPGEAEYLAALRRVGMLARQPEFIPYHNGWRAYTTWIGQLEDEGWCKRNPKFDYGFWQSMNAYFLSNLTDSRKQAGVALARWADVMPLRMRSKLKDAAAQYQQEHTILAAACLDAPWNGEWNEIQRRKQAKAMRAALAIDKRAVGFVERAVGG